MLPNDILALAKANNDVYLKAYETGYLQGWKDALDKALEIIERPITTPSTSAKRAEPR